MRAISHQRLADERKVTCFSADRWRRMPIELVGAELARDSGLPFTLMLNVLASSRASSTPTELGSVVELAAFGFDGFGEGPGFGFFVAQFGLGFRLFEGCDGSQEFFASFGDT